MKHLDLEDLFNHGANDGERYVNGLESDKQAHETTLVDQLVNRVLLLLAEWHFSKNFRKSFA